MTAEVSTFLPREARQSFFISSTDFKPLGRLNISKNIKTDSLSCLLTKLQNSYKFVLHGSVYFLLVCYIHRSLLPEVDNDIYIIFTSTQLHLHEV